MWLPGHALELLRGQRGAALLAATPGLLTQRIREAAGAGSA
jgi:hypothetical protein